MKKEMKKKQRLFDFADELDEEESSTKEITNEEGVYVYKTNLSHKLDKYEKGVYHSIEFDDVETQYDTIKKKLIEVIQYYLKIYPSKERIMIVGLGNDEFSPDALGPNTVRKINATFHLKKGEYSEKRVCCVIPGVKGMTGLESASIIKAIVKENKIDLVICIDSLATSSIERLNKVIQITDRGITPGSGVNNYRKSITKKYLQVPVIAIGIGTVISLTSIIYSLNSDNYLSIIESLSDNIDLYTTFTVKEIEHKIKDLTSLLSEAINESLNLKI